jgi:small subunit ribosomal protein S9
MAKKTTPTKKRTATSRKKEKENLKTHAITTRKAQMEETSKKHPSEKKILSQEAQEARQKSVKYYEAIGRRKTAIARVRLWTKGEKEILINEKPYTQYFPLPELQQVVLAPFRKMNAEGKFRVGAKVSGGGTVAQAEAVRHGIAKALVLFNPDFRKRLRKAGYLTRDPRMRERKKFGLKRARRAPQWQKR